MPDLRRTRRLLGALCGDAFAELAGSWRQHALTVVGIVWGAAAVVLLLSLGSGFHRNLDLGFKKTGDRYVIAFGQYTTAERGGARPGRRIAFMRADLARVRAGAPSARVVAAEVQRPSVAARSAYRTRTSVVSAATPELARIKNHRVARGRYFDSADERDGRAVVVLGHELAIALFGERDPLGASLQLDGWPFEVVGVLARKGAQYMTNNAPNDQMAFIPLSQGQRLFALGNEVGAILANPWRVDEAAQLEAEMRAALLPFHRVLPEDREAIQTMSVPELSRPFVTAALGLEILLGVVGTIVLAMAGVGVANLMVALVNRRRIELAMRRACGARKSDLVAQLLIETLVVVLPGGVLGVALGTLAAFGLTLVPLPDIVPGPHLEWHVVATAFAVLVLVGLASGVAPGRIAARVPPAAALRAG